MSQNLIQNNGNSTSLSLRDAETPPLSQWPQSQHGQRRREKTDPDSAAYQDTDNKPIFPSMASSPQKTLYGNTKNHLFSLSPQTCVGVCDVSYICICHTPQHTYLTTDLVSYTFTSFCQEHSNLSFCFSFSWPITMHETSWVFFCAPCSPCPGQWLLVSFFYLSASRLICSTPPGQSNKQT